MSLFVWSCATQDANSRYFPLQREHDHFPFLNLGAGKTLGGGVPLKANAVELVYTGRIE
jgi:hypothetical protein